MRLHVSAQAAPTLHHRLARQQTLAFIGKARRRSRAVLRNCARQGHGVVTGFGDSHADMRAGDKSGVAHQSHAAKTDAF